MQSPRVPSLRLGTIELAKAWRIQAANRVWIELEAVPAGSNPLGEHRQLREIWPKARNAMIAKASREAAGSGELFYIKSHFTDTCYLEDLVIGITGLFQEDRSDEVCLRWHGVIKGFRGLGAGKLAINELVRYYIPKLYPKANYLIEWMPNTRHAHQNVLPFFERQGFVELPLRSWNGYICLGLKLRRTRYEK